MLTLQTDHNLVLYDKNNSSLWDTKTVNKGEGETYLIMQDDGNLVLYDENKQV